MLPPEQNGAHRERDSRQTLKDLISMTTRRKHASTTSKVASLTAVLDRAWQSARLADRHVMEIRTDVSRYAS
jgi:hypothetical protein